MACIYEIIVGTEDTYIGSTFNIGERERMHKVNTNQIEHRNGQSKLYKKIRECDGNFIIHKLYDVDTDCELELRKAEREAYDNLKPTLNSYRPYFSKEERDEYMKIYRKDYNEKNREKLNQDKKIYRQREDVKQREYEYNKQWVKDNPEKKKASNKRDYEKNKERYSERNKQWRENNKEKKKADDKAYYERTKEQQKIKNKERYERNKEKLNEKVVCECGVECAKKGLKRHMNSKKHLKFIAEQNK